ncbi:MAG: tyrosine-protein phosphatase [Solobacterium sp.]|nr:tyrosine-protein phosphatase [Solobacterium sp.]
MSFKSNRSGRLPDFNHGFRPHPAAWSACLRTLYRIPPYLSFPGTSPLPDEADREKLSNLVGVIVDFRTDREVKEKPDPMLPGVEAVHLPILTEQAVGISREKEAERHAGIKMMREPETARAHMCNMYRMIGSSEFCASQYARFVKLLLEDREKAVLWHCTAGKDRAGFGSVIVEELLGVSRDDIYEDYLMTNACLKEEVDSLLGELQKMMNLSDPASETAMRVLFGAEKEYLDTLYQAIDDTFGGMDRYLRDVLQVSDADKEHLRCMYLE